MMMSTLLNVFFHGLIAFVYDRPATGEMSAYLLDDYDHYAFISFQMTSSSQCGKVTKNFGSTECFADQGLCLCYIGDPVHLEFKPTTSGGDVKLPHRRSVRPFNQEDAADISWLVRMSDVNGDSGRAKALNEVENLVLADLSFDWQRAQACHLDQVSDDCAAAGACSYKIYPNRFQSSVSGSSGHIQALAEEAMFEVKFSSSPVRLLITQRHGGKEIELELGCTNGNCPALAITNDPFGGAHEMLEDVGTHFLGYYGLAAGVYPKKRFPVRLKEGAVPLTVGEHQLFTCPSNHEEVLRKSLAGKARGIPPKTGVRNKKFTQDELIELYDEIALFGIQTRIICPMAMFGN